MTKIGSFFSNLLGMAITGKGAECSTGAIDGVEKRNMVVAISKTVAQAADEKKQVGYAKKVVAPGALQKLLVATLPKKVERQEKKVPICLPGQRFSTPEKRDASRLFYETLHRQIPSSRMARNWYPPHHIPVKSPWMMEHGLLGLHEAQKAFAHKQKWLLKSKKRPTSHFTPLRYHVGTTAQKLQFPDMKFRRAMNCAGKKRRARDSNHAFGMKTWKKKLN